MASNIVNNKDNFLPINFDLDSYVVVSKELIALNTGLVCRIPTKIHHAVICNDKKLLRGIEEKIPQFTQPEKNNYCFLLCNGESNGVHVLFEADCREPSDKNSELIAYVLFTISFFIFEYSSVNSVFYFIFLQLGIYYRCERCYYHDEYE